MIYLGNKLGDSADATVYVNDETVKFEQAATPFSATVTGDLGAAAKVTAKAADKNAVVTIAGDATFGESKQATVTVVSEDDTKTNVYTVTLAAKEVVAPELTSFYGYQVKAYSGSDPNKNDAYRTVTFTDGDKIELAKLSATVTNGTVKAYEYWDGAANGGNGAYATITGDLTVSSAADATWVRLTVTGNDGNTYYFVLNTVYQA